MIEYNGNVPLILRIAFWLSPAAERHVAALMETDYLTDMGNRRRFDRAVQEELKRGNRARYPYTVVVQLADVDNFKGMNDTKGHPYGDMVLREVGHTYRRALRETDISCRFGGDEFGAVLPDVDVEGAIVATRRISNSMSKIDAQMSFGLSQRTFEKPGSFTYDVKEAEALVREADEALYAAKHKKNGKSWLCLYGKDPMSI